MQNFVVHPYLIECESNLHVGSGDNNYGVIDKQVQRDTISNLPVIHASGLKGAFREYFDKCVLVNDVDRKNKIKQLFGSDKDSKDELQQGALRFFEAHLLSFPVRGTADRTYYLATSNEIIQDFNRANQLFKSGTAVALPNTNTGMAQTEHGEFVLLGNVAHIGEAVTLVEDVTMNDILRNLPVIARNSLDNGQSSNLWYEEVVPRKSRLYFFVAVPEGLGADLAKEFNDNIDGKTVQIGANATVGYGYCKITKMKNV